MNRILRVSAVVFLAALSSFAQTSVTGTVIDVDSAANRLQIETDKERTRLTVETDAVATQYNGFGGMIAGKAEIFIGSKGFSNLRLDDRIEIHGTTRGRGIVAATDITLVGRSVAANPTGVGDTRSPSSATTQVDRSTTAQRSTTTTTAEGTVRQVNLDEGRIVIQTPQRRLITVNAHRNIPVYYRNEVYRLSNLEVGDRIRITIDPRDAQDDEITATRIDVVQDIQETPTVPPTGGTVTVIEGRLSRVDATQNFAWVTTRDDEVRVDMDRALDVNGKQIDARDLRIGDTIQVTGSFDRVGDIFLASTVRYPAGGNQRDEDQFTRYGVVTINGTVTQSLDDATMLSVRDRDANRIVRIWVTEDFLVRLKASSTTADKLRKDDNVRIRAFRDDFGNLIAQTITVRNR